MSELINQWKGKDTRALVELAYEFANDGEWHDAMETIQHAFYVASQSDDPKENGERVQSALDELMRYV